MKSGCNIYFIAYFHLTYINLERKVSQLMSFPLANHNNYNTLRFNHSSISCLTFQHVVMKTGFILKAIPGSLACPLLI